MIIAFISLSGSHKKKFNMLCLTHTIVSKTKVRNGIYAYKYSNGTINIEGQKYLYYSVKDAIALWRGKNKKFS